MFKMVPEVLRNLFSPKPTRLYPAEVRPPFENVRGELVHETGKCTFCGVCALKCPSQCIVVDKKAVTWAWDPFSCVYCGICAEACPAACLSQKTVHRPPVYERAIPLVKGGVKNG